MTTVIQRILQKSTRSRFLRLGFIGFALMAIQATPASAQWTTPDASGNINSTNSGNVGIGTASPTSILHVQRNVNGPVQLKIYNPSAGNAAYAQMFFGESDGGNISLAYLNSGIPPGWGAATNQPNTGYLVTNTSATGGLVIRTNANASIKFATNGPDLSSEKMVITGAGNVGIGVINPGEKLVVSGNITGTGNITAAGTIEANIIKAKYQDVAEWVPASEQIPAGTVVVLDATKSNHVTASTTGYDMRVAGVISEQPGITLGESGDSKVLVATTGRVRIKVDATRVPIQIGDLLVTSDVPGLAMKSKPVNIGGVHLHRPGTLIGKALEPLAKGRGEILVLLSLQ